MSIRRLLLFCGCTALLSQAQNSQPLFEELSSETSKVTFRHRIALEHPHSYLYESGYPCGGIAIGDVNGDGRPDLFLVSGPDENVLFLNRGDFVFEKSPAAVTLADGTNWGVSATLADVDGDGDLDLLLANYGAQNRLFLNDGQGNFRDVTALCGMQYAGPSQEIYAADFDNDGDLDLFLLTNRFFSRTGRPRGIASEQGPDGQPHIKREYAPFLRVVRPEIEVPPIPGVTTDTPPPPFMLEYGHPDRLYRNDGNGPEGIPHFTDITAKTPLAQVAGHGLSALIWDVNHDGRPDIYVANDYTDPDNLWINEGTNSLGEFQFREAIREFLPYTSWSSMGSDLADFNGDGRLDFFVADMAGSTPVKAQRTAVEINGWRRWVAQNSQPRQTMRNTLFLGSGVGRFAEAAFEANVARTDWTWAVKAGDFDQDGRPDLFLTTGAARLFTDSDIIVTPAMLVGRTLWESFKSSAEGREQNFAFHNEDGLHFSDVSRTWGLDKLSMSFGAATADLDGDGDLDLAVCNLGENVSLYRNRASQSGAHWLKVRLQGRTNRYGVGALVTARLKDGKSLLRLMNPYTGFLSGNDPVIHFGLGQEQQIAALEVRWPSGRFQIMPAVAADQLLTVAEPQTTEAAPALPTAPQAAAPLLAECAQAIGLNFRHEEKAFDDQHREPLLPAKLSQSGPGIAVGDVNDDGREDLFVGGAAGQEAVLYLQQPDHSYRKLPDPPWRPHAATEDMGALFFDADRDGDLDLYVVSGSNEWEPGDALYADHLYLNQGSADAQLPSFVEAPPGSLPDLRQSGSCVVAADIDLDGDLDLFVGARCWPAKYPLAGDSVLLRNDGKKPGEVKFTDVTESLAPGLRKIGLVTSALWSDVDGDGLPDLLIACEWGSVSLFLNQQGKLKDVTREEEGGLSRRRGWWNSIAAGDYDGDGDQDYLVLNAGTNTRYGRPTEERPVQLYYGDVDGNEVPELIEAIWSSRGMVPLRARHSNSQTVPLINERFPTYQSYSVALLKDVYGEEALKRCQLWEATELASGFLRNESTPGHPRLVWLPLPGPAQLSPGFGAAAASFSAEGKLIFSVAQNSYAREVESGLWRGSFGCSLFHQSGQEFGVQNPALSGFVVPGDGKGLGVIDLDHDGRADLVVSQNNDYLLAFRQSGANPPQPGLAITLRGPAGNPTGVGATVSLMVDGRRLGNVEVRAGEGYLSQSSPIVYYPALPAESKQREVNVRWPDGKTTKTSLAIGVTTLSIAPIPPP